ncbi:stressosome-associated protein Prli42 [Sporolactobacillus sp. CQH2019]|nr:stressosome-associated protein Prli42 [Sporolactobacillus sp. CQH2019]MDD9148553.1 stressosome-associated protein Prli42 [Sporolactobacillus sp. CQH2019]
MPKKLFKFVIYIMVGALVLSTVSALIFAMIS